MSIADQPKIAFDEYLGVYYSSNARLRAALLCEIRFEQPLLDANPLPVEFEKDPLQSDPFFLCESALRNPQITSMAFIAWVGLSPRRLPYHPPSQV
jgi:hypothetical protein